MRTVHYLEPKGVTKTIIPPKMSFNDWQKYIREELQKLKIKNQ